MKRLHLRGTARLKAWLRRQRQALLPDAETRAYRAWIAKRLQTRRALYVDTVPQGLLSMITAVWDGSPVEYLRRLARSLEVQNRSGATEWVIADNGCRRPELVSLLQSLRQFPWVKLVRFSENAGILRGLRACLENAQARYVLPVDADDELYPDALQVAAAFIRRYDFPALLYTDEDKIAANRSSQPYFKPDWDEVLLSNSAYIAHLGIIDREKALALGAYTDRAVEGSVDWDLFLRFHSAGYRAMHIPEVLYRWRIHAESTAEDVTAKSYIGSSQRAVLQRFLDSHPCGSRFVVEESPLLPGSAHFRLRRKPGNPEPMVAFSVTQASRKEGRYSPVDYPDLEWRTLGMAAGMDLLKSQLEQLPEAIRWVCLIDSELQVDEAAWPWEPLGIFELFPDAVAVGGRIRSNTGKITEADQHFGFGGTCASPNRGRSASDPGYFGQMWKQRSVSAVASQFTILRRDFLNSVLLSVPNGASLAFLGAWIGAQAAVEGKRVVYSPYLSGVTSTDWSELISSCEREAFAYRYAKLIPDRRYYPEPFSLTRGFEIAS